MKKLKLEELEVTSFETSPAAERRGTVIANAPPQGTLYIETYEPDVCDETNYYLGCTKGGCETDTVYANICAVCFTQGPNCVLTG